MKLLHKIRLGLLKLLKGIPDEAVPDYKVIQTTLPIKWVSREAYLDIGTLNLASDSKRLEDELIDTLECRKKGLAYQLWKLGSLSQLLKEYPENPEKACPELYPAPKTYKMPDFLKEKYYKREGRNLNVK